MSSSKKKIEHIERIRYPNPLPLPPYPPKLLSIPTPSARYADPRTFGVRLATAHPLPMVVDSEAGMPLNMTDFPQSWYTDQEIEADENIFPKLESAEDVDEEDAFLLSDLLGKLPNSLNTSNRGSVPGKGEVVEKGQVTWLRRTEYLGAEKKRKERELIASRHNSEKIDASRQAQLGRIKESFSIANLPLSSLRHPTKAGLKAVEEHQLLPDPETWASRFDVFRFGDPPGRTNNNKPILDPRLQVALLRPHKDLLDRDILTLFLVNASENEDDEQGLEIGDAEHESYNEKRPKKSRRVIKTKEELLLAEDEATERLINSRKKGSGLDSEVFDIAEMDPFTTEQYEDEKTQFNYTRDYEPHDEINRKDQEIVLTFIDKDSNDEGRISKGELPPVVEFERKYRKRKSKHDEVMTNGTSSMPKDRNVVYYHPVDTRVSLRVRRRKPTDPRLPDHWDAISLGKRSFSMYEKIGRLHKRRCVDDIDPDTLPEEIDLPVDVIEDGVVIEESQGILESEDKQNTNLDNNGERASKDDAKDQKPNEEAEGDDEEQDGSSRSVSASGSEDGTPSGEEELDDDELAALQADAGDIAEAPAEEGRRSRRSAQSPNEYAADAITQAANDAMEEDD